MSIIRQGSKLRALLLVLLVLATSVTAVIASPQPAHADPACNNGGYYVLWARGSGEAFNDQRANRFYWSLIGNNQYPGSLGPSTAWSELGNLDNDGDSGQGWDNVDGGEYPAVNIPDWGWLTGFDGYYDSVWVGVREMVTHLNDRAARCPGETIVLGGYSQGAEIVGYAIQSIGSHVRDNIGYVALYGDPRYVGNFGSAYGCYNPPWAKVSSTCLWQMDAGSLGGRWPYRPDWLSGRFGSWCDVWDGICNAGRAFIPGTHGSTYQNHWIPQSAGSIAGYAKLRRNALNPSLPPVGGAVALPAEDQIAAMPVPPITTAPPVPTITSLKRTTDHAGIRQVYAATKSAVTEAWWHPGGEVHTKEIIHIAQNNIVGFDKVNQPDGTTQSLYTAVPDGVWETWWRPNEGINHEKIVTGLNGVRQVIADNKWESGQYVHRLYLLAQDGPYEVWWKDGGDGVHVSRLDQISNPVTMTEATGPNGEYQLYVATPTYVYELWWYPGASVHHGPIINITQANIRSLDKAENQPGVKQRLYTGTGTGAWQSSWPGLAHHQSVHSQVNIKQIEKTTYNGVDQLYVATGNHVQEYWWTSTNSSSSTLINISQNNITAFDKVNDGENQAVYTASGDLVYETWWRAGNGPNTTVLLKVAR